MDSNESSDFLDRTGLIDFNIEPSNQVNFTGERTIPQIPYSCLNPNKRQKTENSVFCGQCSAPVVPNRNLPSINTANEQIAFCSYDCFSIYKIANRRTVKCIGCGTMKNVQKMLSGGKDRYFCSTQCLSFSRPTRGRPRKRGRVGRPPKNPSPQKRHKSIENNPNIRNKSVQSEIFSISKSVSFSTPSADASTQTDLDFDSLETALVPIPIPIHQIFPLALYKHDIPETFILPIPIPVPIAYSTAPSPVTNQFSTPRFRELKPEPSSEERTHQKTFSIDRPLLTRPIKRSIPSNNQYSLKYSYGLSIWNAWVNSRPERKSGFVCPDLMYSTSPQLCDGLCEFLKQLRKPTGERYASDSVYYLCLGLQQYIYECGRFDNIFGDFGVYVPFTDLLDNILLSWTPQLNEEGKLICRIQEEHLWESKQLGLHSPHVLLNSVLYFNTKHFLLRRSEDHLNLSFANIVKQSRRVQSNSRYGGTSTRQLCLRYYPKNSTDNPRYARGDQVFEQPENAANSSRCPVKVYDFYLGKCPVGIKGRSDFFYLMPDSKATLQSSVWFVAESVSAMVIAKMLRRILFVKEIQEAFLGIDERK